MSENNIHTLVADFLILQRNYQFTRRALMTKERFKDVALCDKARGLDLSDESLKEPLIEHVGHLPILASYLYPHIEQTNKVNLGRALIMLSLHDIGETILGDKFAYTKTVAEELDEVDIARTLIHSSLISYFEEYEAGETFDAKFAKSIDILAPIIHEVDLIGYIGNRFDQLGGSLEKIIAKKRQYLTFDKTLVAVFDICLEHSQCYSDGRPLLFDVMEYDLK